MEFIYAKAFRDTLWTGAMLRGEEKPKIEATDPIISAAQLTVVIYGPTSGITVRILAALEIFEVILEIGPTPTDSASFCELEAFFLTVDEEILA
jgi:hypothetical protein